MALFNVVDNVQLHAAIRILKRLAMHSKELRLQIVAARVLPHLAASLEISGLQHMAAAFLVSLTVSNASVWEAIAAAALLGLVRLLSHQSLSVSSVASATLSNLAYMDSGARCSYTAAARQSAAEAMVTASALPCLVHLLRSGEHEAAGRAAATILGIADHSSELCRQAAAVGAIPKLASIVNNAGYASSSQRWAAHALAVFKANP